VKHSPFARLFETPHGQLLITKEHDEEEGPGICVRFDAELTVAMTSYYDSDAVRNAAFENVDQDWANQQAARMAASSQHFAAKTA
jgi:hypothetical protein